jgi:hypothetical protein
MDMHDKLLLLLDVGVDLGFSCGIYVLGVGELLL